MMPDQYPASCIPRPTASDRMFVAGREIERRTGLAVYLHRKREIDRPYGCQSCNGPTELNIEFRRNHSGRVEPLCVECFDMLLGSASKEAA
jgi:hypothetical protein